MTRFTPTTLAGPDLTLRPLGPQDVDAVVAACADPQTQRWTSVPQPYERRHAQDFIEVAAPRALEENTGIVFALDDGSGLVGCLDLKNTDWTTRCTEVGYWVAPAARGRGLASAATRLLAEWAIRARLIERVELRAAPGNAASLAVAARAGFRREGVARNAGVVKGGRVDLVVFSLVSGDL